MWAKILYVVSGQTSYYRGDTTEISDKFGNDHKDYGID